MIVRILLLCVFGLGSVCALVYEPGTLLGQEFFDDEFSTGEGFDFDEEDVEIGEEEPDDLPFGRSSTPSPVVPQESTRPASQGGNLSVEGLVPESHDPISNEESFSLLDKAEALLVADEEMSPMDMIRSVSVLIQHGNPQHTAPYMKSILRRFNAADLGDRELFDIADQLGASALASILTQSGLSPESGIAVDRILEGYQSHLKRRDAVEAVLLWKELKTPMELMRTASELSKVGRVEIAGVLFKRFLDTEATDEELAEINASIGTADILRILTIKELQPQSVLAVERIVEGTKNYQRALEEPNVRENLVKLRSGNYEDVTRGIQEIWRGSRVAIPELIEIFSTTRDEEEIVEVGALLRSLWSQSKDALALSLHSDNPEGVLRCARLLYSRIARDEVYLLYPALFNPSLKEQEKESVADCIRKITNRVPDREAAALELHRIAVQYVDRDRIVPIDAEGFTTLWIREKSTGELRLVKMPAMRGISTQFARFAEEAYRIAPELARVKTLHYTACFEQITGELDPDRDFDLDSTEISQIANSLSLEELEDVLQESLQRDCTGAGIVSATLLGNLGTAESVVYLKEGATRRGARILPRILVQATQSKNRRIRFAATEAVMKLNPMKAYPGSSLVSDSLSWFAKGEGRKTAIIASPHIDDAMKLSGSLIALGYTTKIATTNTEAMREALASPDVRLVIVDWNCTRPIIPEFAQKMRSDSRTHEIPIAVIARDEQVLKTTPITKPLPLSSKFERSVSSTMFADSIAMILPYPQDDSQTAFVVGELLRMSGVEEVPDERRLEQSKKALRWLAGITRGLPRLYRIENLEALATDSAYSPALHREGIELAAQMQSNRMQVLLVNIATTPNLPASFRDTAGNAFAQSVQKHGILIRGQQIGLLVKTLSRQYEEERPDPVLESIVRTIEQKNTNR